MAIGRITGQMLSSQLNRDTTDLKFSTTGETNLLVLDATNDRIGVGVASPTVQFETSGSALIGTDLTVTGNLTVNGSTTTINTTNLTVDDKNIELAHSLSGQSPTDAAADGGGIILKGDTDHTILWSNANDSWDFSEHLNVASGKAFRIGDSNVLDANNLTLENIQIAGNVITSASNADISLQPSGTGKVVIEGIQIDGTVITGVDSTVISFGGNTISGIGSPSGSSDAATKGYVDTQVSAISSTLGFSDSSSNTGSVVVGTNDLEFRSGDSLTLTVAGNGVTASLNDNITVNQIGAKDSTAVSITSPLQVTGALQTSSSFQIAGSTVITAILDEDTMSSDSASAIPTQQSVKAYVDSQITATNSLTLGDDASSEITLNLDDVLNVKGGNSVTSSVSGDSLTFGLDANITVNQIGALDSTAVSITSPLQATSIQSSGNVDINGTFTIGTGSGVTTILDEDNMASNSDTALATQQSIKAYVDAVAGGTITLGDSASNAGSVNINAGQDLEFRSGDSITLTVSGNGVTADLNETISVDTITAGDSTAITMGSPVVANSTFKFNGDAQAITQILDEDNFASNSATALATQQSIKAYVDAVAQGLHVHASVHAIANTPLATITGDTVTYDNGSSGVGATLTLSTALDLGGGDIDGDTDLQVGDRIIINGESNKAHNGIYVITSTTVLTRATDFDTPTEMAGGDFVFVTHGTLYADTGWVLGEPVTTVGTTNIDFIQFSGAGAFTAGDGLTLTGTEFSVNVDSSTIEINADTLRVKDAGITNVKLANSTITVVGDDSTGTAVSLGETFKIAGGDSLNSTVSADTLTINLDDNITVNQIGAKDSSAVSITSPLQATSIQTSGNVDVNGSATIGSVQISGNVITSTDSTQLNFGQMQLTDVADPTQASDVATKSYVDSQTSSIVTTIGISDSASNSSTLTLGVNDLEFRSGDSITPAVAGTGVTFNLNDNITVNQIGAKDSSAVSITSATQIDGTLQVSGASTLNGDITIASGSITSASGSISFGNENLSTTGNITGVDIQATGNLQVDGNLTVSGTTTSVNSTNITVSDPMLILSETNSGGADVDSGIMIERGSAGNNAVFYWNEGDDRFKAVLSTSDGTTTSVSDDSYATVNLGGLVMGAESVVITSILDEDNMASNSATALATQQSIKAYVDSVSGGTITLGDSASNSGSVNVNGAEELVFRSGDSITMTVSGNGVTSSLNDNITVNQIGAKDSTAINITSPVYVSGALNTDTSLQIAGSTLIDGILDEDNMASNSATKLATQQSIKAYVDSVAGGTITLGDSASNAGSVDINGNQDLEFRSGDSITMTVSGNGVTTALNDNITVNQIGAKDSTAISLTSNTQVDGTLQVSGTSALVGNVTMSGTFTSATGSSVGNLTLANGSITDSSGTITFDNENLTTTGNITGADIQATGNLQVDGNLTVSGTTTSVNSTNITVSDPMLILSETNSGGADVDSGIMVERGSAGNNAVFYWNEGDDRFKAVLSTSDGTTTSVSDDSYATLNIGGLVMGAESVVISSILDEDAFGSDSATALATQQSIKAYVDTSIGAISSTLGLSDSSSNTGSVVVGTNDIEFRSGDSLTLTVAGNGVTASLNDNITVNQIGAKDSTAINITSPVYVSGALNTDTSLVIAGSTVIDGILDEDNFASNSATKLATQQSIKAYVDSVAGGTIKLGDSASNSGTVDINGNQDLEFRSGDSITATVSGNGVTFDLNETISVDTITAGDSTAITVQNDVFVNGNLTSNSVFTNVISTRDSTSVSFDNNRLVNIGLPVSDDDAATKSYVDDLAVSQLSDLSDVDADGAGALPGDVLISSAGDSTVTVMTLSHNLTGAMRLPSGNTSERPSIYSGIIRYNTETGKYEGSTDGSTWNAFAMEGTAETLNKDVFTGDGGATYNFSNVTTPLAGSGSNGATGLIVYIDNVLQEPTQNYTITNTAITFDSVVHSGARIVVIQGFDGGAGGGASAGLTTTENTDVDSAIEQLDVWALATYRAAKYTYRIENADTSEYQAGEILVVHDGSAAYFTEYAKVLTGNNDLITFSVGVGGGNVILNGSANTPNSNFRAKRINLEVA